MDILPATSYQSPTRQVRAGVLNTIKEESEHSASSDSEGSGSDRTVVGRPAGWNPKVFIAAPRRSSNLATHVSSASSPVSSVGESPVFDADDRAHRTQRSSYATSESGTVFSEESCPSLASDPTTFATDSNRNSVASSAKSGRNRYPALLIPRGSWSSIDGGIKEIALGMSPTAKVVLSPEVLSQLSRPVPAEHQPPSLGGNSSIASDSPCLAGLSAPGTPDSRLLELVEGQPWGQPEALANNALEIAIDEDHSLVLSPAEAHGPRSALFSPSHHQPLLSAREREWGEMVTKFPDVPGATPQSDDNPFPALKGRRRELGRKRSDDSDSGIVLPSDAFQTLQRITREMSPDELSEHSHSHPLRNREMRELSGNSTPSRRRSLDDMTPASETSIAKLSEYSFSKLSIPSPGGFLSSLAPGSRQTWCINRSVDNSVPTSAVAENFYFSWKTTDQVQETTLTIDESTLTDGPPTAKQTQFNNDPPTASKTGFDTRERTASVSTASDDADMYGPGPNEPTFEAPAEVEYEEAYEEELKQAAEQHVDRTSDWLAAQTSYMSALRETNPLNKPEDYPPSPKQDDDESRPRSASIEANIQKTVRFLEEAKASADPGVQSSNTSPGSEESEQNPVFHAAFQHFLQHSGVGDAFLQSSSRLDAVRSSRTATPHKHIHSLQGRVSIDAPTRPKYSGPFNQNPRATGIFERSAASLAYEVAEREQRAMRSVQESIWQVQALRATFNGRLLASAAAEERLRTKAKLPLTDPNCTGGKRIRVLDLGGDANASWGWSTAHAHPNVKVYTVVTKDQASHQRPPSEPKPAGPSNHRTVSVPHLWNLPFKNNHFDVISARTLHALLKANPVPSAPEIDEWTLTLKECMRTLKPGGYIDFIVLDSSIARAGPRGEALGVEFGFDLHRRGYERDPARSWLRRLKKEGFVATKRAWMFWPMGRRPDLATTAASEGGAGANGHAAGVGGGHKRHYSDHEARVFLPAPRPVSEVSTISKIVNQYMDVEAVQGPVGSTQAAADITGLLGTRMYEEWLVKVRAEAGFRVLVGWARKPRPLAPQLRAARVAKSCVTVAATAETKAEASEKPKLGVEPAVVQHQHSPSSLSQGSPQGPNVGTIPLMIVG
jgi:SAM-dependent methyltransferase